MFILFKSAGVPYMVNLNSCLLGSKITEKHPMATVCFGNKELLTDLSKAELIPNEEAERAYTVHLSRLEEWRKLVDSVKI